jgi:hypothetical protein
VLAQKSKEDSKPKICTGGVINSKVTSEVQPIYPEAAKKAEARGQIIVMVRVDEEGNIYEAIACSGHKLLRQPAVNAALQTKIAPTVLSGKAVKVAGILLYVFNLKEEKGRLVESKAQPNKSMDVRAKHLLSYQRHPLNFSGLGGGFGPRHLNRWSASLKMQFT